MGNHSYERQGDHVHAKVEQGTLHIHLGPTQVRKIALLRLPYSVVSFRFAGMEQEQQLAFKTHFDLHFQRGGG